MISLKRVILFVSLLTLLANAGFFDYGKDKKDVRKEKRIKDKT